MDDLELISLVAETNAYPNDAPQAEIERRPEALREVRRRFAMETTDRTTTHRDDRGDDAPGSPGKNRWLSGPLLAAAVFVLVIGVGAAVLVFDGGASPGTTIPPATSAETTTAPPTTAEATTAPPSTEATTTTVAPTVTVDEALAVTDQYFAAYAADDLGAMMDLFAPETRIRAPLGFMTPSAREMLYAWKLIEGTVLTKAECGQESEPPRDQVRVEDAVWIKCEYAHHQYPAILVGAPATPFTSWFAVTGEGISGMVEAFHSPAWVTDGPFESWMGATHPDDRPVVVCCTFASVEDARSKATRRAQFAEEWAAYLEANDCNWDEECARG